MSARFQNLTAVVVGALAVACSKPATDSVVQSTEAPARTEVQTTDQPLVSALEAGQADIKLVRPAEKKSPQPVAVKGKGEVPGTNAGSAPTPSLDIGEVTPTVIAASQAPAADVPVETAVGSAPHGPSLGGGEGIGSGGGVGQEPTVIPEPGMGPGTIIIRGGAGGIEDDCKRHPNGAATPGYPGGGIAINNRMPTLGSGPVMANNPSRQPFTPGRMGGTGGIGVGRRGIR
jgi:hypothetical protein